MNNEEINNSENLVMSTHVLSLRDEEFEV